MDKLKKLYNDNLQRIYSAMKYLDSPERTEEEKEKWVLEYKKLLLKQELLMKKLGLQPGDKEILEGFKE